MNPTVSKFFRRTLYTLLLSLAVLVILGTIIISQLDLEDYRDKLEQELSSALEQPVRIGHSKLTLHKGIALRFRDIQIGPDDALLADIPFFTATLKIGPLLEGNIFLDRVEIEGANLQFWLPIINRPERGTTHELTDRFGIRTLLIRDASLKLHKRQRSDSRELIDIKNLHIELHGWQPNQAASLLVSGELQQPGQPAELLFDCNLPSSPDPAVWRNEDFTYQLRIKNLATAASGQTEQSFPDYINLNASILGIPAKGAQINAIATDVSGRERLLRLAGQWKSTPEQDAIKKLAGELLGLPLSGEFYLLRQEQQQFLAGRFGAEDIKLTPQLLAGFRVPGAEQLLAGNLERLTLIVEKSWTAGQPMAGTPRFGAEFTVADLEWAGNSLHRIQDFSAELALENQQLEIRDGLLVAGQQAFFFSGEIDSLFKEPQLDLKIELQARLEDLGDQLKLPDNWKLSGPLTTNLLLGGPLGQPDFLLQANATTTVISLGSLLQKKSALPASLLLEGFIDTEQLQLDRLELRLPETFITGNGCFTHDPESDFFLLDIDPINLSNLQAISPLLKTLRLQGTLHPTLERTENGLVGSLQLINAGAYLNNIVGDLKRTTGRIDIDRQGLSFDKLQASFGESAFVINGRVPDWQAAQLDLQLRSNKVRAQDLIFRNQKLNFYDLDGRVQVDGKGINFTSIKVELEKETEVVVTGSVVDFKNPQVSLDISAEKANIDQVIDLFVGPRKRPAGTKKSKGKPLLINARVKKGSIGNLQFQNAEGLIKDHHRVFTLYPLQFSSGKGFCLARIELDHNRKDSLLKVSGHAEEINATILHQDMFKERGLINGALRGDFYLEGRLAGGNFWQNARGGIHLQVENGTLRKFRSLARVFSLLNVSQLFAGKLPDMDKEGMPFSLLEGSLRIADGRAYTEDMRIISEAMNMSMIGSQSLIDGSLDYQMGVMPLRTVDKVITSIPLAGWVLTGEDKALLTAHFRIEGSGDAPKVTALPVNTVSDTVFGIFKRTLGLPGKVVKDIGSLFESKPTKKTESPQ